MAYDSNYESFIQPYRKAVKLYNDACNLINASKRNYEAEAKRWGELADMLSDPEWGSYASEVISRTSNTREGLEEFANELNDYRSRAAHCYQMCSISAMGDDELNKAIHYMHLCLHYDATNTKPGHHFDIEKSIDMLANLYQIRYHKAGSIKTSTSTQMSDLQRAVNLASPEQREQYKNDGITLIATAETIANHADEEFDAKHYTAALYLYKKVAENGNAAAQNRLGYIYQNGLGITMNVNKANEWFRKSAENGDEWGQYNLGVNYQYGQGLEQDEKKAMYWLKKSKAQGNADAATQIAILADSENNKMFPPFGCSYTTLSFVFGYVLSYAILQATVGIGWISWVAGFFVACFVAGFLPTVTKGLYPFMGFLKSVLANAILLVAIIITFVIFSAFSGEGGFGGFIKKSKEAIVEYQNPIVTATVKGTTANLRSEPSMDAKIIKSLKQGDTVTVTGESAVEWTPISYEGETGWMKTELLEF